jgi:hypothetical protein
MLTGSVGGSLSQGIAIRNPTPIDPNFYGNIAFIVAGTVTNAQVLVVGNVTGLSVIIPLDQQ